MLVRDCMTPDPIAIRPGSDPLAAKMILRSAGFRHLPVVNKEGRLVGILDRADLDLFLSEAGAPDIMQRQHRVEQAMTREVVTVPPSCPLEEAATLMVKHKIGCLPVLEEEQLVGIITETDVFKQFAAALGGGSDSLRLTVQVVDTPGQLAELAGRIAGVNGNICSAVACAADEPQRINITLRVEGVDRETVMGAVSGIPGLDILHAWGCGES